MKTRFAIGIDLGGSRVKAGLVDANGLIIRKVMQPSPVRESYEEVIGQLAGVVVRLQKTTRQPITRIGVGVAGLMNADRSAILTSPNCPVLAGHRLAGDLARRVKLTAAMDNDANLMALGEGAFGAARGCRHFVAITLGTGVGGAVVSDGRLIRGIDGGGGELGHVPVSIRGLLCGCGARGCLEAYVGKAGIDRHIARYQPRLASLGLKEINERARKGDADAQAVFAYIGRTLAVGLAGFVNLFNPELIVIGGGVAAAGRFLFAPLELELRRRVFKFYLRSLKIMPADLGDWAGVVGAATIGND